VCDVAKEQFGGNEGDPHRFKRQQQRCPYPFTEWVEPPGTTSLCLSCPWPRHYSYRNNVYRFLKRHHRALASIKAEPCVGRTVQTLFGTSMSCLFYDYMPLKPSNSPEGSLPSNIQRTQISKQIGRWYIKLTTEKQEYYNS
jgi:hypothetical protein